MLTDSACVARPSLSAVAKFLVNPPHLAFLPSRLYIYSAAVFFIFNGPLKTNYLRMYPTNFTKFSGLVDTRVHRNDHLRFPIAQQTLLWQPILGPNQQNLRTRPSFIALAFQNGLVATLMRKN